MMMMMMMMVMMIPMKSNAIDKGIDNRAH
jgi:hypothetical protein